MQCSILMRRAFLNALGLVAYVVFAALVMTNANKLFGTDDGNILNFMIFLLFFVFSASVSASLVLGKPILMYLDGQKKEAVKMFLMTVGCIFIFFVIFVAAKILMK